jgi:hypothetical protein
MGGFNNDKIDGKKVLIALLLLSLFTSTLTAGEGVHPEPTVSGAPTFTPIVTIS